LIVSPLALFRQQHINIIRDALPVCVKRQGLEIKEFPAALHRYQHCPDST
jgi:hypothetical protein